MLSEAALPYLRLDLDHAGIAGHHDVVFLHGALQLHVAAGQRGERQRGFAGQIEHGEIVQALQFAAIFIPPDIRRTAVADDHDLIGAPAGFADGTLVGQADIYPALNRAGEVFLPQIGLLIIAHAFAESQQFVGIKREGEQPHHHALIGFRRMPRQRQRVVGVIVAIHIGDLEGGFEDGCFDGHEVFRLSVGQARILAGVNQTAPVGVHRTEQMKLN